MVTRVSSAQDLLTAVARTAARRGQQLRLLDGWRPAPELAVLDQNELVRELTAQLPTDTTAVQALRSRSIWQCVLHADPNRPPPPDARFAEVARRILAATGIAAPGDPQACRWIVVHTDSHEARVLAPLTLAHQGRVASAQERSLALAVCQLDEAQDRSGRLAAARTTTGAAAVASPAPRVTAPAATARPHPRHP